MSHRHLYLVGFDVRNAFGLKNLVPGFFEMHFEKRPTKEPCLKNQKLKLLFCTKGFVEIPKEVEHY